MEETERMVNEVGRNSRECRGVRKGKKRKCSQQMRVINVIEWCSEAKQGESGIITFRFDQVKDVDGFDKSFV